MTLRLDPARHDDRPWRVRALAPDFTLLDLWEIPLAPSPGATFDDFHRVAAKVGAHAGAATALLMRIREVAGRWFGWDARNGTLPIPGCTETSVTARLTDEDRRRDRSRAAPAPPRGAVDDLHPVYLFDDEALFEISNSTIHALLHLAWMGTDPPSARLAVYVKHRGLASRLYMAAIMPFRWAIVYPAWIRGIQRAWRDLAK